MLDKLFSEIIPHQTFTTSAEIINSLLHRNFRNKIRRYKVL